MGKVKDRHNKKRAVKLKDKRLAKMKGKGRKRRPSTLSKRVAQLSESKKSSQRHDKDDLQKLLRESEQQVSSLRSDLANAKQHLRDLAVLGMKSRSKDLKALAESAQHFLDATAPGID